MDFFLISNSLFSKKKIRTPNSAFPISSYFQKSGKRFALLVKCMHVEARLPSKQNLYSWKPLESSIFFSGIFKGQIPKSNTKHFGTQLIFASNNTECTPMRQCTYLFRIKLVNVCKNKEYHSMGLGFFLSFYLITH